MADRRSIIRWNRNADINTITTSLRLAQESLREGALEVVLDATEAGAEGMREAIRTDNQTQWVGKGQFATEGRQDHGLFLDGVKEDAEIFDTVARGKFGWIKSTGDWGDTEGSEWLNYFGYQEHGFRHWLSGNWIPGVQAAYHGAQRAKAVMAAGMKRLSLRRKVSRRMKMGYDPKNGSRDTW